MSTEYRVIDEYTAMPHDDYVDAMRYVMASRKRSLWQRIVEFFARLWREIVRGIWPWRWERIRAERVARLHRLVDAIPPFWSPLAVDEGCPHTDFAALLGQPDWEDVR